MEQYIRNMGIMNQEEFQVIKNTKILLIGVGGLGGYIASSLVRLGVECITLVDFDDFEMSNLNRQIFSTRKTLNKSKVSVTKEKLLEIDPNVIIHTFHAKYDDTIDESIYDDIDIVFDAVDNIESKLLIEAHCTKHNKPLIHGAIGGWYGQIGIILPNSDILKDIYQSKINGIGSILPRARRCRRKPMPMGLPTTLPRPARI